MLEAPIINHEVVEEISTSTEFDSENDTISFSIKFENYVINADVISSCFKIPNNTNSELPSDEQLIVRLNDMGYSLPISHLGKIVRKGLSST